MIPPASTLHRINPDGSEHRECGCGKCYTLPVPYDKANPAIRDMCPVCISTESWRRAEEREEMIASKTPFWGTTTHSHPHLFVWDDRKEKMVPACILPESKHHAEKRSPSAGGLEPGSGLHMCHLPETGAGASPPKPPSFIEFIEFMAVSHSFI